MPLLIKFDITAYLNDRLPNRFESDSRGWLIGPCLWHADGKRPNLGVRIDTGSYRCLACNAKGDVVSLVQRIENLPTYDEAAIWLESRYGVTGEDFTVELRLGAVADGGDEKRIDFDYPGDEILQPLRWRHPYLETRGITEEWQRRFEIGYSRDKQAITLPWRDRLGRLVTVKYRSVFGKAFWYSPSVPAGMKNRLLYGLHHITRRQDKTVWIAEAEIDAISLWQSGRPAVALGGNSMSAHQAFELTMAGVEHVALACDRDRGGEAAHESIRRRLSQYGITCVDAVWPDGFEGKDCNELLLVGRIDELRTETIGFALGRR